MPHDDARTLGPLPLPALLLALAAVAVPAVAAVVPAVPGGLRAVLWLLALAPAFVLGHVRGWRGVAGAVALGMALLALAQGAALARGVETPDLLLPVIVVWLALALALAWLAEVLHRQVRDVEELAFTDLLTELPNRRHAGIFLENEFAAAERGRLLCVVLFDLDDFKPYNDRCGHAAGDDALRTFADILARTTRRMNLSARFGGEEFVSVLAGSDPEGAVVFAERVRTALKARKLGYGPLTVSAGVAAYHPGMLTPDALLAAADHALYQAKRDGRDRVRLYAPSGLERGLATPELAHDGDAAGGASTAGPPLGAGAAADGGAHDGEARRRVLLVEDEDQVRHLIATFLTREGFDVTQAGDVGEGMKALREEYDVLITDIRLPGASGNELVVAAKSRWPSTQVVVITGLQDAQVAAEALNAGADRYLFKPFGMPELRGHLVDALERRDQALTDRAERRLLSTEARERAEQAREAILKGARALVKAVEVRDPYTRGHSGRVAEYALCLAEAADPDGRLFDRETLRLACELHDVGKIGVPDAILNKEGRLTGEEFERVRRHPRTGRSILEPLLDDETVLAVVSWHHERWDGTGYPDGLTGEAIPAAARLVGLADALDAMTSRRAYRRARPWDEAVEHVRELAGVQFDPGFVEAMGRAIPSLRAVYERHQPSGEASAPV